MLACPSLVHRTTCNYQRVKAGRQAEIAAIVIHPLTVHLPEYENSLNSPLPDLDTGHINPLSVHFLVSDLSAIQLYEIGNTVYGLDYLKNPAWPGLSALMPLNDVNAPFIHIGIRADCSIIALVNLICCIIQEIGINIPVIASSDLQSDRPKYELSSTLITQVADCVASGGNVQQPPNWIELWDRVQELEVCCFSNKAQINQLKQRVSRAEINIAKNTFDIKALQDVVAYLGTAVSQIPAILETIRLIQEQIGNIIENCCPVIPEAACFTYQLLNGQEQTITPNQPVHLNPPTRVIDTEPPIVTVGPLWRADLSQGNCTWYLDGIVRFKLNQWCTGKFAKLWLVVCGQRTEVAYKEITNSNMQLVQLQFSDVMVPAGCNNVFVEVEINDQTAQIVTFAEVKGCCR